MAQNARFGLSIRVLTLLAQTPDTMATSAALAKTLDASPVMIRRIFASLHDAGLIVQRKGPQGGTKLKVAAKSIGVGDVFAAVAEMWPPVGEKGIDAALKRVCEDAMVAMNETSIATLAKKMKKS